jgi:hypothetical protein
VNEKFVNQRRYCIELDGGSRSEKIARADITFFNDETSGKKKKLLKGSIIDVSKFDTDPGFMRKFGDRKKVIDTYVNKVIAKSGKRISSRDAYFGSFHCGYDTFHSNQSDGC